MKNKNGSWEAENKLGQGSELIHIYFCNFSTKASNTIDDQKTYKGFQKQYFNIAEKNHLCSL